MEAVAHVEAEDVITTGLEVDDVSGRVRGGRCLDANFV